MNDLHLTQEECKALHEMIEGLSGGNAEYAFTWDGTDDISNTADRAAAKLYMAAGAHYDVPEQLQEQIHNEQ